jgi:hypothetical protein
MGCCDPIGSIAEHAIAHAALGVTGGSSVLGGCQPRRDTLANRGTAADWATTFFWENQGGSDPDRLWISGWNGTAWEWRILLQM